MILHYLMKLQAERECIYIYRLLYGFLEDFMLLFDKGSFINSSSSSRIEEKKNIVFGCNE